MDHVAHSSGGRGRGRTWTRFGALASLALALATLGGCAPYGYSSYGEPVGYATVTSVPYNVYSYPNTYYNGRTVYWVDNRWMYSDGSRWAYYQNEPPPLHRYRTTIQQAPPARQYYPAYPQTGAPPPGSYPPASAPPAHAPPATRVR